MQPDLRVAIAFIVVSGERETKYQSASPLWSMLHIHGLDGPFLRASEHETHDILSKYRYKRVKAKVLRLLGHNSSNITNKVVQLPPGL